jgi:hypothetical protein
MDDDLSLNDFGNLPIYSTEIGDSEKYLLTLDSDDFELFDECKESKECKSTIFFSSEKNINLEISSTSKEILIYMINLRMNIKGSIKSKTLSRSDSHIKKSFKKSVLVLKISIILVQIIL